MRIRSRLLMLVLAILVPAFLAAALGIVHVYRTAQEEHRDTMREVAQALALVLDKELERRVAILHTLAQSPALDTGDVASFYEQARRVAPTPDSAIILHNVDGGILFKTREPAYRHIEPDLAVIHDLRQQYGSTATFVSNLYFSPSGQAYSFSVQTPVWRDGRIVYYLQLTMFADHLQALFDEQRLPPQWLVSIVDRNGTVMARNRDPSRYVGQKIEGPLLQQILSSNQGFLEGAILRQDSLASYFSRTPQWGWSFLVSLPQHQLRASALRAAAMMTVLSLLLLGLALGVAVALGRSTARRIETLGHAAQRLGAGLPVKKAASGLVEIDAVNAALVQASEDIHRSQEELNQRVEEAVALAESSQKALLRGQKLEALGRLTGGIAHDFNNVLQTLTTGLQVVAHSTVEPRALSALEACQRALDRCSGLVRQLMAFGRAQESHQKTVFIDRQLTAITPMLHSALSSNIALQVEVAEGLWPVVLDPLQFELALLNLTINARDAMPAGGTVRIRATNFFLSEPREELPSGEYVCLTVSDTGSGMSEDTLAHAFDPFFTTKRIGEGAGLGLPQAYGFARQSGGLLTLESHPGKGTIARFYLPRATVEDMPENSEPAGHEPESPSMSQEPASALAQSEVEAATILLVEDDPLVREVVQPALAAAGFQVRVAHDGEQALHMLQQDEEIDLVFSDIVMPGSVSGIDLAEWVQRHRPGLQVVLATGYSEQRLALPGVRVLSKPYEIEVLQQLLYTALLRGRQPAS